jgi:hypothetical protein
MNALIYLFTQGILWIKLFATITRSLLVEYILERIWLDHSSWYYSFGAGILMLITFDKLAEKKVKSLLRKVNRRHIILLFKSLLLYTEQMKVLTDPDNN